MNQRSKKLVELALKAPPPKEDGILDDSISAETSSPGSVSSSLERMFSSDDSVKDQNYCPSSLSETSNSNYGETQEPRTFQQSPLPSTSKCIDSEKPPKKWAVSVRKERSQLLNTGKSYVNFRGKVVLARQIKPSKECRKKCHLILKNEERIKIFEEYWALGSHDKRVSFVAGMINSLEKKTTRLRKSNSKKQRDVTYEYSFQVNGQKVPVCKECFCSTLNETDSFIKNVLKNKSKSTSGVTIEDRRGKNTSVNKKSEEEINEVRLHIHSFPTYESHYTRKTNNNKYLPSNLNLRTMYNLYQEIYEKPVSRKIYEREFRSTNLKFKKPSVDTCHKCDTLQMQIKVAANKEQAESELKMHQEKADLAYESKRNDKMEAATISEKKCYSFDLQQCLATPLLSSSVVFYKRQLWTYNLTVHDNSNGESTNYMWHEAVERRGANEIGSCLYQHLLQLPASVKEVTLYSDTCGGQNKNSHICAMFLKIILECPHFEIINHKFLEPGHTHMECDIDHSMIEKRKKKVNTPIYHPHDWYQLVRGTGKKNQFTVKEMTQNEFYDFANLLSNALVYRKKK